MRYNFLMEFSDNQIRYIIRFYGYEDSDENVAILKQNIIDFIKSNIIEIEAQIHSDPYLFFDGVK